MRKLSAALLAVAVVLSAPLWGDPVAHSATTLSKSVKRALGLAKKADKRSKTALKRANTALRRGGPAGPTGPRGATGATGPAGPAGTVSAVRTRWSEVVPVPTTDGETATAMAICEDGERVISGGYRLSNLVEGVTIVVDRPADSAGGAPPHGSAAAAWRVSAVRNGNGTATDLTTFALCAT